MFARITCMWVILCVASPLSVAAKTLMPNADSGFEPPFQPILLSTSILIDSDETRPIEPVFKNVKYKNNTPFNSIEDRINRLAHGVSEAIPPEFDHYGHEIRKYMAKVGNDSVFTDEEYLKDQIKSVKKARVILDYWSDYLQKEQREIEKTIAIQDVTTTARTNFKQNKAQLKTFLVVLKSWIDANERFLKFIFDNPDIVVIEYPEMIVTEARYRFDLYNLYAFKQQKLKELQDFQPFEMMVY